LTDQWIAQSSAAEAKDIVAPKRTLELTAKQLKAFVELPPANNPLVAARMERLSPEDRAEFATKAAALIEKSVYPAWRKLAAFVEAQAKRAPPCRLCGARVHGFRSGVPARTSRFAATRWISVARALGRHDFGRIAWQSQTGLPGAPLQSSGRLASSVTASSAVGIIPWQLGIAGISATHPSG
jgi:hypothetical protein